MAVKPGLYQHRPALTEPELPQILHDGNVKLHGEDFVFHFTKANKHSLQQERRQVEVRPLSRADETRFASFTSSASEQDLDDAYVELDHGAVFGAFEHERQVCVASMSPWSGQKMADVGVSTLPTSRGKGHAGSVVRVISQHALELGYDPHYRCQIDNKASLSWARAAGLERFGTREVISPDSQG